MDWTDVADWTMWGVAAFISTAMVVLAVMTIIVAVCELIFWFMRARASADLEELLESIPAVPYQRLPRGHGGGGGDADDGDRESCVICVAPYEAGDPCSVLPGCSHTFHKPCVDRWLRTRRTCPLCRGALAVPDDARRRGYQLSAVELMV